MIRSLPTPHYAGSNLFFRSAEDIERIIEMGGRAVPECLSAAIAPESASSSTEHRPKVEPIIGPRIYTTAESLAQVWKTLDSKDKVLPFYGKGVRKFKTTTRTCLFKFLLREAAVQIHSPNGNLGISRRGIQ